MVWLGGIKGLPELQMANSSDGLCPLSIAL